MCGTGRVLVPCLARGAKMHGVDQSPSMVARCEGNVASAGFEAPLFRQDVAHLNVPFRYGCAIVAGGALQLLDDPTAMHAALERMRAHLVPPGKLVIECRIPATAQQNLAAPLVEIAQVKLADGSQIVRRSETTWTPEAKLCRAQHRYTHRRGSERLGEEHETIASTWYERDEIVELVRAAGFREVAIESRVVQSEEGDAFYVIATI
jgi:cyclopropane fatty-acyl-phospholipid synthase-like methyltransferase